MPRWHSPVGTKSQDQFAYFEYVEPLATQLFNAGHGFTLGIFGGWGQGKTSLMEMLHHRVKQRRKTVLPIWFDAWKFDRADVVWRALLAQTLNDIELRADQKLAKLQPRPIECDQPDESIQQHRDTIENWQQQQLYPLKEQLYRSFTRIEKGDYRIELAGAAKLLGKVLTQAILPGGGLATRVLGRLLGKKADDEESDANLKADVKAFQQLFDLISQQEAKTYYEHIRHLEQFQDKFHALIQQAKKHLGIKKLIFFIDDLDRCEPEKAIEVLEAIKLFLSTPDTVFVIGVDDEVIHAGLQRRYGDWLHKLDGNATEQTTEKRAYSQEYLEKNYSTAVHATSFI